MKQNGKIAMSDQDSNPGQLHASWISFQSHLQFEIEGVEGEVAEENCTPCVCVFFFPMSLSSQPGTWHALGKTTTLSSSTRSMTGCMSRRVWRILGRSACRAVEFSWCRLSLPGIPAARSHCSVSCSIGTGSSQWRHSSTAWTPMTPMLWDLSSARVRANWRFILQAWFSWS